MRKATFMAVGLMMGAMAFVASPALAGYEATDVMLDQADHSTFAGINWLSIGAAADENPSYGNATIVVPYIGVYGGGCATNVVDQNGSPIPTSYNCSLSGGAEVDLLIQDLFTAVTEGNASFDKSTAAAGDQGISQYLDNLFVIEMLSAHTIFIDQTLDQDLADLTAGGGSFGIYQTLHQAFDRVGTEGTTLAGFYGINQTVEAVLQEESGATVGTSPLTASGVTPGIVVSYLGQSFTMGSNATCGSGVVTVSCATAEWGGHGTTTNTPFDPTPAVAQHDP